MEPLHPQLREALKNAHPGLTDEDIDTLEELSARCFECHPEEEADQIRELNRQRTELIRQAMPRYNEITQAFSVQAAAATRKQPPRIEIKRRDA
jgi:hypothetical protein